MIEKEETFDYAPSPVVGPTRIDALAKLVGLC
jgi:hypothetical protein